ncbi:putative DNA helicase [Helianthus annuus]|nr:putative DNA helicase [Helianthus annuus]
MKSNFKNKQLLLFVYGHGGTGKTYLWTTIICALRASKKIVLAVAASGIASLLLPSGRTTHSRFKIPLDLTDDSICYVKKNTQLDQLLIETSLIIWDEAPMSDRRCFESLDKTLKDILDNSCDPFGGKSVLLGGDFRQTLPVKIKASKFDIINSSLPKSYLWPHFKVVKLLENMRLHRPNLTTQEKADIRWFSSWLLEVGNGTVGTPVAKKEVDIKVLHIPQQFLLPTGKDSLADLIRFIYDADTLSHPSLAKFSDKAIVCPKNKTADEINDLVLSMCDGTSTTYLSSDSMTPHMNDKGDTEMLYPIEYINMLNFNGFPPRRLDLKPNTPIILLRNINQAAGLCNGTRLLLSRLLPRIIEAQVITGIASGHRVYIPRINFVKKDQELPFIFKRKQFPIKVCYAMTINKSQGQSLNKIGIYLPESVFSHGQLYVALSRATSINALKVLIVPEEGTDSTKTKNIVFFDFLNAICPTQVEIYINTQTHTHPHPFFSCVLYIYNSTFNFYIYYLKLLYILTVD